MARPGHQQLALRQDQLDHSAATAGATSTVPTQKPISRASISGGDMRQREIVAVGVDDRVETARDAQVELRIETEQPGRRRRQWRAR